ncbi:MAG TPA: hypothetical protein VHU80_13760 [Polyangiaceae bacterium]|jgi:hypothetical protein|nr:hypothetical protein [Polyangiaceae bacterium]
MDEDRRPFVSNYACHSPGDCPTAGQKCCYAQGGQASNFGHVEHVFIRRLPARRAVQRQRGLPWTELLPIGLRRVLPVRPERASRTPIVVEGDAEK